VHVTLRAATGVPSLRSDSVFPHVLTALTSSSQTAFRVVQFSAQADHVHLIVEADALGDFVRGCQGLAIRLARAVNRAVGRRGVVWGDRYHARWLRTPREARAALVYVLQNWRKHAPGGRGPDPKSSAAWFDGWREQLAPPPAPAPVQPARTWLLRIGWWRGAGKIAMWESPRTPKT